MTESFSIILIAGLLCFSSCLTMDTKCCDHVRTDSILKGLYVEHYRTFCAGVFGEVTDCYLTDSISFRKKIGSYDEHESFFTALTGNRIVAYNTRSTMLYDTIEKKTITKDDLWKTHHTSTNLLATSPIFGKNTIKCDSDFYPASAYKNDDGYYMSQVQYKCGNDYSNAVFYTDTLNFCVFIGIYIPGSFQNDYKVKKNGNSFEFYNIEDKPGVDTVKIEAYLLSDLKKAKLINICK